MMLKMVCSLSFSYVTVPVITISNNSSDIENWTAESVAVVFAKLHICALRILLQHDDDTVR